MAHLPVPKCGTKAVLLHLILILVLQSLAYGAKLLDGSALSQNSSGDQSGPSGSAAQKISGRRKLLQKLHSTPAPKVASKGSNFLHWSGEVFRKAWASTRECWHSIQHKMHADAVPTQARRDRHKAHVKAPEASSRLSEFLGKAGATVRGVAERLGFVSDAASTHAQNTRRTNQRDGFDKVREVLSRVRSTTAKEAAGQHDSSEQGAVRSAAKRNEIKALTKRSKLPAQGRVAVIVRGRAFRAGRFTAGCMVSAWGSQKKETKSLMAKVVDPLLDRGNSVDMFVSEASGHRCSLRKDLMTLYGSFAPPLSPKESNDESMLGAMYTSLRPAPAEHSRRNLSSLFAEPPQSPILRETDPNQVLLSDMYTQEDVASHKHRAALNVFQENSPRSISQRSGLIAALEFFKRKAKRRQQYDLILIVRHDLLWKMAIDEWDITADYTMLNFMSKCEPKTKIPNCVNDMAWTLPGSMYDDFESSIGRDHCFNQTECINKGMCHGHGCKEVMMNSTGSTQESYLTQWAPKWNLREKSNPIAEVR